jgi:hypothetical protein
MSFVGTPAGTSLLCRKWLKRDIPYYDVTALGAAGEINRVAMGSGEKRYPYGASPSRIPIKSHQYELYSSDSSMSLLPGPHHRAQDAAGRSLQGDGGGSGKNSEVREITRL